MSLWVTIKLDEQIKIGDDISLIFAKSKREGYLYKISIIAPKDKRISRRKIKPVVFEKDI